MIYEGTIILDDKDIKNIIAEKLNISTNEIIFEVTYDNQHDRNPLVSAKIKTKGNCIKPPFIQPIIYRDPTPEWKDPFYYLGKYNNFDNITAEEIKNDCWTCN